MLRGLAREDLFTVVHEQVLTDTAHYADLVLPATTSMEHLDLYRSFGQLYAAARGAGAAAAGRGALELGACSATLARALGVADATHYAKSEEALIRELLAAGGADHARRSPTSGCEREGSVRLDLPRPYLPFADGAPTPSGKVEFYRRALAARGLPALPTWTPLAEGPANARAGARAIRCSASCRPTASS